MHANKQSNDAKESVILNQVETDSLNFTNEMVFPIATLEL